MLYADTDAGRYAEPSPGATGTCPLCGGAVLARCGEVNAWHWAHRAGKEYDRWAEPLTDWHRAYQRVVPAERCEVVMGRHRADVVAATGQVLELQHSSISVDDIAAREAHYGPGLVWLFDARAAYHAGRLHLRRGSDDSYVTFRWKQPRRSVLSCRRFVLLDLGAGLVLRVRKIYPGPPYGGWGHLFETAAIWRWLQDGTRPAPVPWTSSLYRELIARIVRMAAYVCENPPAGRAADETSRVIRAALFAGDRPSQEMRAALHAAAAEAPDNLAGLRHHAELHAQWSELGYILVCCWCGEWHGYRLGPDDRQDWIQWSASQHWPRTITVRCPSAPERTHPIRVEPPPSWWHAATDHGP